MSNQSEATGREMDLHLSHLELPNPTVSPALGSHRQLLLRCTVTNPSGDDSVRFIEHSLYPLWRYLVTTRHAIRIRGTEPCLWVPDGDRNTRRLFSKDDQLAAVSRLQLQSYDPTEGITTYQQRFIAQDVLEIVLPLLQDHWTDNPANQHLQVESGDVYHRARDQHAA